MLGPADGGVLWPWGAGHAACSLWASPCLRQSAWRSRGVQTRTTHWLVGLFVGIAGRRFVGVSGALHSMKTQQRQFTRAGNLRAALSVLAAAPASYHRQRVRSLRASLGDVLVACGAELEKGRALRECVRGRPPALPYLKQFHTDMQ